MVALVNLNWKDINASSQESAKNEPCGPSERLKHFYDYMDTIAKKKLPNMALVKRLLPLKKHCAFKRFSSLSGSNEDRTLSVKKTGSATLLVPAPNFSNTVNRIAGLQIHFHVLAANNQFLRSLVKMVANL